MFLQNEVHKLWISVLVYNVLRGDEAGEKCPLLFVYIFGTSDLLLLLEWHNIGGN